jgi:hypothetical protein
MLKDGREWPIFGDVLGVRMANIGSRFWVHLGAIWVLQQTFSGADSRGI